MYWAGQIALVYLFVLILPYLSVCSGVKIADHYNRPVHPTDRDAAKSNPRDSPAGAHLDLDKASAEKIARLESELSRLKALNVCSAPVCM